MEVCTEMTLVSGTGMKISTVTGGTGIHIVPNLPKCPVPVLVSYRTYQIVQYRCRCHAGLIELVRYQ